MSHTPTSSSVSQKPWARRVAMLAVCAALLSACATEEKNEYAGWSVTRLYTEGHEASMSKDYTLAAKLLEATIAQYPFSVQATQAQLELPYVYWKDENRVKALAAADRFIALNASHPQIDYMYYLKGLMYYNAETGYLRSLLTREVAQGIHDQQAANRAFEAFKTLVSQYPNSRYAGDAKKRMGQLVNTIAAEEIGVARYYYERQAYVAAVNRAQNVLKNFNATPALEEALLIMVKSYDAMKMPELRDDTIKILNKNFPNSGMKLGQTPNALRDAADVPAPAK